MLEPDELPEPIEPELGDLVLEPVEPPEVLPEPIEPEELPEEPVELPLLPVELEPLVPPLELLEPDLLKCASHSERETWPSLLVSTDEKLGVLLLPELDDELGELDEPPAALDGELLDELGELDELPLADGEDELLPDLELSAAKATDDRTKSAAAVVTVTDLIIGNASRGLGKALTPSQAPCRVQSVAPLGAVQHVGEDAGVHVPAAHDAGAQVIEARAPELARLVHPARQLVEGLGAAASVICQPKKRRPTAAGGDVGG